MQCTGIAPAARCAGAIIALVICLVPASPAAAEPERVSASPGLLIPSGGWHGRPIQQPHRHAVRTASTARPPRGWEAGPAQFGTGTRRPSGSQRVREVQWRLRALGYRPGPIDGIFGVRTRAAVAWFQVKHGFHVDGRATLALVRHLRQRTTPGAARTETRPASEPRSAVPSWQAYRELVTPVPTVTGAGAAADGDAPPFWWLAGLALLAFAVGFAAVALHERSRRSHPARPPAPALPEPPARALGYVRVEPEQRVRAHATAMEARCADHGLALAGLVTDEDADDRAGRDRPGLAFALRQLQSGEADCLVVGRLGHLSRSPSELDELLDVMSERETPLVVLNSDPAARGRSGRWEAAREGLVGSTRRREGPDG